MSISNRPFLKPSDIPAASDLDVVLFGPFWPFANGRGPVELVMMTLDYRQATQIPFVRAAHVDEDLEAGVSLQLQRFGRPFSLKICGEGWIRIETQLGNDLTAWPGHPIRLYRAGKVLGSKQAVEYVGVRALTRDQRIAAYGGLA